MAKKTKVVEIKSVLTEPQRGAGEGADPNDPVGIYYPVGGIARLIGSLAGGDEDEAVIKTGGTIVEHDINVRYREPAAGWTETNVVTENGIVTEQQATRGNDIKSEPIPGEITYVGAVANIPSFSDGTFLITNITGDITAEIKYASAEVEGILTLCDGGTGTWNIKIVYISEESSIYIMLSTLTAPSSAPVIDLSISSVTKANN